MARVLLLETDRQLAASTKDYLKLAGHSVAVHHDPQTAVMSADKTRPDLIILDLMLAGRSGIEFLYELRSYPDWQAIPAIATGYLPPAEAQTYSPAFEQLNVAGYMPKQTSSLAELADAAARLLAPAVA